MTRRSPKRKYTQYVDVPAHMRGHLPNYDLYTVDHRLLNGESLAPSLCSVQQRNQRTIVRLLPALIARQKGCFNHGSKTV